MNNFIFICEEDFKHFILQAVILAVLFGNNNNENCKSSQEDFHNDFHKSNEN